MTETEIVKAINHLKTAITPDAVGGNDATGGWVTSHTEAVMGVTAALCRIADAIQGLSEVVRESQFSSDNSLY